ncbi:MAG: phage tail tube protein [Sphingomonadales bacterium]|nr:phage tail tube protein [Sphingomonadales bacterium]MBD3772125.1 phage tail tube protein [Paracoccaceae bacterium]
MANKNRVVGQVKIKVDGQLYPTSGEATMEIGGPMRENVPGDYEAGAFKETTAPAKCEVSLLYKGGVSLAAIRAIEDATITLETDNGQTWIMRNAYCSEAPSFGQDGKAKCVFEGPPAEEML